jgi:hypothetical protein
MSAYGISSADTIETLIPALGYFISSSLAFRSRVNVLALFRLSSILHFFHIVEGTYARNYYTK